MWENNIKQHNKVKIPLNFSKLCSEVESLKRETTLTVEREVTPTQNHHYHWRLRLPIFSRKWTILGSFIMLNLCIYLLKPFKRKTCSQNLTLHKMSWGCLCIVTVDLKRMNQCEKRVCKLYTKLLLVLYAHICFNTHFPFCVCIYLKHKHRQYAPQRLSRNNSR